MPITEEIYMIFKEAVSAVVSAETKLAETISQFDKKFKTIYGIEEIPSYAATLKIIAASQFDRLKYSSYHNISYLRFYCLFKDDDYLESYINTIKDTTSKLTGYEEIINNSYNKLQAKISKAKNFFTVKHKIPKPTNTLHLSSLTSSSSTSSSSTSSSAFDLSFIPITKL